MEKSTSPQIQSQILATPLSEAETPHTQLEPETLHAQLEPEAQRAQPDSADEEFRMFITLVFGVSIFGASTFAVSIGQMTDPADIWRPKDPPFILQTVRSFLGAAWLCFTLSIALASIISSFLILKKNQATRNVQDKNKDQAEERKRETTAIAASALLWTLLVAAFLFIALAMVPYAYVPGWIAVA
ncbi:hypothetical protein E8E14_001924 [Neopestalotiopsis sp. 37M]|nr:hypothetical protein E8E14_001924 [Neopestalotiopsis sp. 37M]